MGSVSTSLSVFHLRIQTSNNEPRPYGGVEEPVFAASEQVMEAEQGGGLEDHRSAEEPTRTEKRRPEAQEETVQGMEVWGSSAGSLQHQELVFKE